MNAHRGVIRRVMCLGGKNLAIYCQTRVMQKLSKSFSMTRHGKNMEQLNNPKCAQCMAHCGYEATAVEDTLQHPWKALISFTERT
jgi:hypothetical protein